jgi:hypothetical protein
MVLCRKKAESGEDDVEVEGACGFGCAWARVSLEGLGKTYLKVTELYLRRNSNCFRVRQIFLLPFYVF